jgi:2-iminobutanoate/2-iminopropanoate deaminase
MLARLVMAHYTPCVHGGKIMKRTIILLVGGMLIGGAAVELVRAKTTLASQQSPARPAQGRRVINLPDRSVQAPFSDAVLVGDTLYLAGRIGLDPTTNKPPEDVEQEARLVLDGMRSVLLAAGMTMDDLVTVTVYCPDMSLFNKFNGVYRTYFHGDFPARAFIGSGPLLFGGRFEVQAIAVRPRAMLRPISEPR